MADKQPVRSVSAAEKAEPKNPAFAGLASLEPQTGNLLLEQAAQQPGQSGPDALLQLNRQYGNAHIQRALEDEREPDGSLPVDRRGELTGYVAREIQRARAGGSPLPAPLHRQLGDQLQGDFSQVRLHTDRQADRLSGQLQARAFTLGNNIFFRKGAYAPHTARGRFTLLHELTHVQQQSGSPDHSGGPLRLGPERDRFEQQANQTAARQAGLSSAGSVPHPLIQREGGSTAPATTVTAPRRMPPLPPSSKPALHQAPNTALPPIPGRQPAVTAQQPAQQTAPQTVPQPVTQPAVQHPAPQGKALPPIPAPKTASKTPAPVTNPVPPELEAMGVT
ncbi:MAG: DUF4157 domain-containing protein, partial [Anaerolineaceae bacterium]